MLKQVIKEMRGHLNPHSMVPKNVLKDRPDWFKLLDEIALNFCQENEYIQESLLGN